MQAKDFRTLLRLGRSWSPPMPEGVYIAASPSLSDFDVTTLGFERYGGPLLVIPRAMLDAR